jgi:H/ACA ribonucleoprotein complex subunit 4
MGLLPFERQERQVLVRREMTTDPGRGMRPEDRPVETLLEYGVISLNKPAGPTSHLVAEHVQRILHIPKAGHGGTLDPGVTGVLPVVLGRATRITQALLAAGKEYVCLLQLHADLPESTVRAALREFTGTITQLPPVKSAVARRERERDIYYIDILAIEGRSVLFRVGCQAGTYIRKLCHDIGQKLGCGGHMAELVRTKAGPFTDKDWVTLQDLEDAYAFWKEEGKERFLRHCIKPVETAVAHLPKVWIGDSAVSPVCHGASLHVPGVSRLHSGIAAGDLVAVMTLKDELVGLGTARMASEQLQKAERGIAVAPSKVFMQPETYGVVKRAAA